MAWSTGFLVNAEKSTSGKQEDLCMRESKNTTDDKRLARTQASAVSEQAHKTGHYPFWNEVKFIDRDPHWYTRRVKEAIHIRLHPDNINRDSRIGIPEPWMPTIKKGQETQQENGTTTDH